MNAAVFLDRDNTLIHNDGDLGDPELVRLVQGAASAVASLCGLGYKVVVVSNQGGVARGHYTEDDVQAVNQRMREMLERGANGARIDGMYYCPFHPEGTVLDYRREHPTRKPQPGMLVQAAEDLKLDLKQSWMIGDQLRDVEAGAAAGTRTVLIQWPNKPRAQLEGAAVQPEFVVGSLIEAVRIVAQQRKPEVHQHTRSSDPPRRWDAAAVAHRQKPAAPEPNQSAAGEGDAPADDDDSKGDSGDSASPGRDERHSGPGGGQLASVRVMPTRRPPRPFLPMELPAADEAPPKTLRQRPPAATQPPPAVEEDDPPQADEDDGPSGPITPSAEATLRQILHELRNQRGANSEFSYVQVLAIMLQTLAGVCLLGALWMGAGDTDLFQRWLGTGLLLQGACIALLLYARVGR